MNNINNMTIGIISNVRTDAIGSRKKILDLVQSFFDGGYMASKPLSIVSDVAGVEALTNKTAMPLAVLVADSLDSLRESKLKDGGKEPAISFEVGSKIHSAAIVDLIAYLRSQAGSVTAVVADGHGRASACILHSAFLACAKVDGVPSLDHLEPVEPSTVDVLPNDWQHVQHEEASANALAERLQAVERAGIALSLLKSKGIKSEADLRHAPLRWNKGQRQCAYSASWLVHHAQADLEAVMKVARGKRVTLRKETEEVGKKTEGDRKAKREAMAEHVRSFLDEYNGGDKKAKALSGKVIQAAIDSGVPTPVLSLLTAIVDGDKDTFEAICGQSTVEFLANVSDASDAK